jgi:P27 family predicted phage terminase small subunit
MKDKKPPKGLSKEASDWWKKIVSEYVLEDSAGYLLLQVALESFDTMRACQKAIKEQGLYIKDRWGQLKVNPLTITERDSKAQLLASLKSLNLDIEVLRPTPGRPGGR